MALTRKEIEQIKVGDYLLLTVDSGGIEISRDAERNVWVSTEHLPHVCGLVLQWNHNSITGPYVVLDGTFVGLRPGTAIRVFADLASEPTMFHPMLLGTVLARLRDGVDGPPRYSFAELAALLSVETLYWPAPSPPNGR